MRVVQLCFGVVLVHIGQIAKRTGAPFGRGIGVQPDVGVVRAHARGEGISSSSRPWALTAARPLGHALLVPLLAKVSMQFCKVAILHITANDGLIHPQPYADLALAKVLGNFCKTAIFPQVV